MTLAVVQPLDMNIYQNYLLLLSAFAVVPALWRESGRLLNKCIASSFACEQ